MHPKKTKCMFPNSYFKKAFYSLFLLFFIQNQAQNYSIKTLDSLTEKLRLQGNIQSSIQLNQDAIQLFEKKNNVNGLTAAYINMGGLLWSLHRYRESLEYLEKAEEKLRKIKNYILCAKMYGEYSRNYASLGLLQQANTSLDSSIYFLQNKLPTKSKENSFCIFIIPGNWQILKSFIM